MHYTDEGHPYFINGRTGESQWEDPRKNSISNKAMKSDYYNNDSTTNYGDNKESTWNHSSEVKME